MRTEARSYRLLGPTAQPTKASDDERLLRSGVEEIHQSVLFALRLVRPALGLHTAMLLWKNDALADPALDDGDLRLGQRVALVLGRHALSPVGGDKLDEQALVGLAGRDRVVVGAALAELGVAGHFELAAAFLGVVAGVAVLLEDRGHVVDEADRLRRLGGGGGGDGEEQEGQGAGAGHEDRFLEGGSVGGAVMIARTDTHHKGHKGSVVT